MEQRTIERFRKQTILIHWLFAITVVVMLITGGIMFFDLANMAGARQIRTIHRIAAVITAILPLAYLIIEPMASLDFVKQAFIWDKDAVTWLQKALRHYFKKNEDMPPQGYLNGDQKLWQLVVLLAGVVLIATGILLWFFRLKISIVLYQWTLLAHALSFLTLLVMFPIHLYLTAMRPGFEESLGSMVDGKVSESYASNRHTKWMIEKMPNK